MRLAFFAQLPRELADPIGTVRSGVHPERPTPSADYRFTGKRDTGMRARYDARAPMCPALCPPDPFEKAAGENATTAMNRNRRIQRILGCKRNRYQ